MTNFRTQVHPAETGLSFHHADAVLCMGSCFAEHIGSRLAALKFRVFQQPFGIVYNPLSMARQLHRLSEARPFTADELVTHQGLWHSFEHHGRFSGQEPMEVLEKVNRTLTEAAQFLRQADRLLLTLGTAHVFFRQLTGQPVANCHKFPAAEFDRRRLDVPTIRDSLQDALSAVRAFVPSLRIVLTVSPVRHWRDGPVENQRSKATLLLACEELARLVPGVEYFPSYEIMMDDLRDYRFYAPDMIHPNEVALQYIWEQFESVYFREDTRQLCRRVERIRTGLDHRPIYPDTDAHRAMLNRLREETDRLEMDHPTLDLTEERLRLSGGSA
ncbi:MAG: hypothetical protein RLY31_331 [Bacteroidota bacterium]|jgi:hypothetical protein